MAEETKTPTQSGDPGSTPGSAEGDRETVEQDLEEKGLDEDTEKPKTNSEGKS